MSTSVSFPGPTGGYLPDSIQVSNAILNPVIVRYSIPDSNPSLISSYISSHTPSHIPVHKNHSKGRYGREPDPLEGKWSTWDGLWELFTLFHTLLTVNNLKPQTGGKLLDWHPVVPVDSRRMSSCFLIFAASPVKNYWTNTKMRIRLILAGCPVVFHWIFIEFR